MTHSGVMWLSAVTALAGMGLGCSASAHDGHDVSRTTSRDEPQVASEARHAGPVAALSCPTPLSAPLDESDVDHLGEAATLRWNPDTGGCALGKGYQVEEGWQAIARFSHRKERNDLHAVSPWRLASSPETPEPPASFEADSMYSVDAVLDGTNVVIEFRFSRDAAIVLSKVEVRL